MMGKRPGICVVVSVEKPLLSSLGQTAEQREKAGKLLADLTVSQRFSARAVADNTGRAYQSDWRQYRVYCEERDADPRAETSIRGWMGWLAAAGIRAVTVGRKLSAVRSVLDHEHGVKGHEARAPEVIRLMRGIRNSVGMDQDAAAPLLLEHLAHLGRRRPRDLEGIRNKALLLVGWAGAFRRSELVALRVEDIRWTDVGVVLRVVKSKRDQERRGTFKAIRTGRRLSMCPVAALRRWLAVSCVEEGPVWRGVIGTGVAETGISRPEP